jgi:hypothetical protein
LISRLRRWSGTWFQHVGEIQIAYRGQRGFPPALSAESSDPGILVRGQGGIQVCGAHRFYQRWGISSV